MTRYSYTSDTLTAPALGLIVLQTDETIENDFRRMFPQNVPLYVSRVPSDPMVTSNTLQQMQSHLAQSASMLPAAPTYAAVGYGCTSGTAQIGPATISERVKAGADTEHVTEPLSALVAACRALGVARLAFLSPYVASVSERLRQVLAEQGVTSPVVGGFDEAEEAKVVRIDRASIHAAACDLARSGQVNGVFLSCTNLRCLDAIAPLEAELNMPVMSSNQVLAWHMGQLAGIAVSGPGRLFEAKT
jgi:maleate isomerase